MRYFAILDLPFHQTTRVQIAAPGEGDEPLGVRPQRLRLCLGRLNAIVAKQAGRHIGEQRPPVTGGSRQLLVLRAMAHYSSPPSVACAIGVAPGSVTRITPSTSS